MMIRIEMVEGCHRMISDSSGYVYCSGRDGPGILNPTLIKYDTTGEVLWSKMYSFGGPSLGWGLLENGTDIYMAGVLGANREGLMKASKSKRAKKRKEVLLSDSKEKRKPKNIF